MNAVPALPPPPSPAPRWSTLTALALAVTGVHLALLVGPVGWSTSTSVPAQIMATGSGPEAALAAHGPKPAADTRPLPVAVVSPVRWIAPPVPVVTAPPASARPVTPPPRAAPRPAPPAPGPVEIETAAPPAVFHPPAEQPAQAPLVPPEAAADTLALASPASSDAAPITTASPTSTPPSVDRPVAELDDEYQAAAGEKRNATAPATSKANASANVQALPPASPPASIRLDYTVSGRVRGAGYAADGQLDWTVGDGRYSARMEMRVFLLGSRVQTSTGRVGPSGLSPERFADRSRSEKAAHFDTTQQRIRFSNNAPEAVLLPGAQDRLSLFLQIAGLLQARPQAYSSGHTIELPVVGTGDADIWRFVVGDEVMLSLPAGDIRARLVKRLPRKEFDSTVELWLAPQLQHLPVRLRVTQSNGDVADQQLSHLP